MPASLINIPSPDATAVVPLEVPPSIRLISAAVAVTPSKIFNSAAVEVTPSKIFNSAVVAVTPSIRFNSVAVAVTPSRMLSSAAVAVTAVPFIDKASVSNVPSTSTSPDISKLVKTEVPTAVILSLNVAAPAADMSRVRAVISLPPSLPFNIISLSEVTDLITKSVDEFVNSAMAVPPSLILTSPPSASSMISPATSKVRSPELKSISVPSIVMLSTVIPALASKVVPLINFSAVEVSLAPILLLPAFLFENSSKPSSEPSDASSILAVTLAYMTS